MTDARKDHIKMLLEKASTTNSGQEAQEYAQAAYLVSQTLLNISMLND